jgi:toxin CptA
MSIAVSAVLKPSRVLLVLVAGMCLGVNAIGWALGFGLLGGPFSLLRVLSSGVCISTSIISFYYNLRSRKTLGIDISGIGQIRLNEYTVLDEATRAEQFSGSLHSKWQVVRLREGSILWPMLLVLFVEYENGSIEVLQILPDCVPSDTFRALAVACRWIGARNHDEKDDLW